MNKKDHRQLIKADLKNAKQARLKLNVVIISTGCCDECEKINGVEMPFEDAEKKPPIPYKNCTRKGGCTCAIGFQPVRDGEGSLIKLSISIR